VLHAVVLAIPLAVAMIFERVFRLVKDEALLITVSRLMDRDLDLEESRLRA
jgi:hypothetical protein